MKNRSPIRGVLVYSYYASGTAVGISLLVSLVVAISFLLSGVDWGFQILVFLVTLNLPMSAMVGMAGKQGKWERFQLTMPIKRSQLLGMQYLTMLILFAIAVAILIAVIGASIALHDDVFYGSLVDALVGTAHTFGLPLLMTGLVFPLSATKPFKDNESVLLMVCMGVSMAINVAVPNIAYRVGLPVDIIPTVFLALTAAIFVVSYFISKAQYARSDF